VAEITNSTKNTTLVECEFELLQQGGCGSFFFTLAEPYTQATIDYDYRVEIYLFTFDRLYYTGKITKKPIKGTGKPQTYEGYGYFYELEKKLIDTEISPGNDIATDVTSLLDTYITPNTSILKDTSLIETVGYTRVSTFDVNNEYAKWVFDRLSELAVDYKYGVNAERKFYFQAIDTSVQHYWYIGKHLTEFEPEEDTSDLVKKVIAEYPELFSDGYELEITSEAGDYSGLYEKRYSIPEFVNPFSSTNLASGITPSTNPAGTGAANLTDGDYSTLWTSDTNQASGHYIKIDLGSVKQNIAKVVIDSIHDDAKEYNAKSIKIEISSDDASYTTVLSSDSDIGWKPELTFRPTAGRYVKISLTQSSSEMWKVGEIKIYQLDLSDAQRWADGILAENENVKKRATAIFKGVDRFILKQPTLAPIEPKGKAKIFDEDGTEIDTYQIKACRYTLSASGLDLELELGDEKKSLTDEMKDMERRIREAENTDIRRAKNLSLSKGFQLSKIEGTYIGKDAIQTKHLSSKSVLTGHISVVGIDNDGKLVLNEIGSGDLDNIPDGSTYGRVKSTDIDAGHIKLSEAVGDLDDIDDGTTYGKVKSTDISAGRINLNYGSGKIKLGLEAIGAGLDGMVVNDGTHDRVLVGEVSSGNYGITIKDSNGNVTVNLGDVMGASDYKYVSADNSITTSSSSFVDMTNMTITHTFPKCICYMFAVIWGSTTASNDIVYQFNVDGSLVGYVSGQESGKKIVSTNMHVQSLSAGSHTVKIQWKTTQGGVAQEVRERRLGLIFWEVP